MFNGDSEDDIANLENLAPVVDESGVLPVVEPSTASTKMVDLTLTRWEKLNYELYKQIRQIAPFGAGNPEPVFKMEKLHLHRVRPSGKEGQHVQFWFGASQQSLPTENGPRRQGTLFKGVARLKDFEGVSTVTIIFRLEGSEDGNKQEVWLRILDIFPDLIRT